MIDAQDLELIKHVLVADEGMKLFPYMDCCGKNRAHCQCKDKGKLTVGVGRNLDDVGITEEEALYLLSNNVKSSINDVERSFGSWFNKLNSARQLVIICMAFNMGIGTLKTFQKMIKSIESGDFNGAANHMLNSKWAAQVGRRAVRLSETMRSGVIQG